MTRADAAPACVLAAGTVSAVLTWRSLTGPSGLPVRTVLVSTLVVVLAAALVATRSRGRQRRLAVAGALVALAPVVYVAVMLSRSDG